MWHPKFYLNTVVLIGNVYGNVAQTTTMTTKFILR